MDRRVMVLESVAGFLTEVKRRETIPQAEGEILVGVLGTGEVFSAAMSTEFFAFGEILWDCLPTERHAGGAPFNVAANLAQLGASVGLLSAVGDDALGAEIVEIARVKGVDTRWVGRSPSGLATGTVQVTLDAKRNATYEIVQPVAWDEIAVSEAAWNEVSQAEGIVFGTLAARSAANLATIERLVDLAKPVKFFDVNFRQPFVDFELTMRLAQRVDVLKLNDAELAQMVGWLRGAAPREIDWSADCETLAAACGGKQVCVTRGAEGAVFWSEGTLYTAHAPRVTVKDTIGAGDAFTAALMLGLTRGEQYQDTLEDACRLGAWVASQNGATPVLNAECGTGNAE